MTSIKSPLPTLSRYLNRGVLGSNRFFFGFFNLSKTGKPSNTFRCNWPGVWKCVSTGKVLYSLSCHFSRTVHGYRYLYNVGDCKDTHLEKKVSVIQPRWGYDGRLFHAACKCGHSEPLETLLPLDMTRWHVLLSSLL